ncbi:MAG: FecR family protein, partial [Bacteroidota bacterium]
MFEEKDDTIMARWLANELTEAERIAFEASPEYEEYMRLKKGLQALKKPDFEKEALRAKVWQGIENQKPIKVLPLKRVYYTIGIAASILLLLGFFFKEVSYTSGAGEKLEIELPDGTMVSLNAQTTLKRNRFFWNNGKEVELIGEAFFEVTKGDDFMVKTPSGTVSVLGTQFNVKARTASFEVFCYEGKVRYDNPKNRQQSYLEAGDAVRLKDNILLEFKHVDRGPLWQSGRSTFSNAEISE